MNLPLRSELAIDPVVRIDLCGRRVPVGSVPIGFRVACGSVPGAGILECLPPVPGTVSVLPYACF